MKATLLLALGVLGFVVAGCGPQVINPDPATSLNLQLLQVTRAVNDASDIVIAANHANKLTDDQTDVILRINWQVLDVIALRPQTWPALALASVHNARQALSPDQNALVGQYLASVISLLQAFEKGGQ